MDNFWNDKNVKDFVLFYNSHNDWIRGVDPIKSKMDEFKESKQPKPEYEILSFVEKDSEADDKNNPMVLLVKNIPHVYNVEDYLKIDSCWNIFSVKRPDGQIFEVGKVYQDSMGRIMKPIKKFTIGAGVMYAIFDEGSGSNDASLGINSLSPLKEHTKPLFKYNDFKIYDGDKFWYTNSHVWRTYETIANKESVQTLLVINKYTPFKTEDEAKEWVLLNKPVLSLKDLYSIEIGEPSNDILLRKPTLIKLAKSKL